MESMRRHGPVAGSGIHGVVEAFLVVDTQALEDPPWKSEEARLTGQPHTK
jgi:hypothetical protein